MRNHSNDRELIELAATACGYKITLWDEDDYGTPIPMRGYAEPWNPLAYDGDALRLAVKLRLCVHHTDHEVHVSFHDRKHTESIAHRDDPGAATRRAIVRAAAALAEYPRKLNETTTTTDRVPNATHIAACDPDTIRELLEERDALAAKVEFAQSLVNALRYYAEPENWKGAHNHFVAEDALYKWSRQQ